MKKILFINILLALSFTAKSQSLEFNQVLLINSLNTVPQGKVWKVQSALSDCSSNCSSTIVVNNQNIYTYVYHTGVPSNSQKTAAAHNPTNFPIWLPSGTTLDIGGGVKYISVIEFNE